MVTLLNKPDIENARKAIVELNSLDYKNESIVNIQAIVQQLMDKYAFATPFFGPGLLLFRGIKYSEKPRTYTDIIYPPKDKAKINRASDNSEQMFYASTSKKAVFYELDVQVGEKLIISTWCLNNNLIFSNVGYTKSNFENLGTDREMPIDQRLNDPTNNFIADSLAKSFCQQINESNNYLYKLSIAIARAHLNDVVNHKFAGLFYPTIKLNGMDENFAILTAVIDQQLFDLENIQFIEIVERTNNLYQYKIIDMSDEIENGLINWRNLENSWTLYDNSEDLFFTEDNYGKVASYNKNGDIILPDK